VLRAFRAPWRPRPRSCIREYRAAPRRFAVFRANLLAQLRYIPKRIAAPMLLVRPTIRDADESSDARWREVSGTSLTRLEVPGDHFTMLKAPAAGELARILDDWFATNSGR
jgi:thioesterase domain-containing protein